MINRPRNLLVFFLSKIKVCWDVTPNRLAISTDSSTEPAASIFSEDLNLHHDRYENHRSSTSLLSAK
jgi:hypothetical protein